MQKRTKIVATIGPASEDKNILRQMIEAGMNVARINFSHSDHAYNGKLIDTIQALREEMGIPVGIMADLQGPRIRTIVEQETPVEKDEIILISDVESAESFDEKKKIILDHKGIVKNMQMGEAVLIEDGLIRLKVVKKEENFVEARVENGGVIKNHKGVNLPDTQLELSALSEKDLQDLEFALGKKVEYVAMSFVGNKIDIKDLRNKIRNISGRENDLPWIVAKIERKEAIKNLSEIVSATDVVMVARGDLGIEMPESEVAVLQKDIIAECLKTATPVIVATQMMDSMIENPIPTRAEVSDVTNAVVDHADAVMLSGETANGKFPVEVVKMMAEIILETEKSKYDDKNILICQGEKGVEADAILEKFKDQEIVEAEDNNGEITKLISNRRTEKTIRVATQNKMLYNQFSVVWGIKPEIV